jgi:hypothetical protein
MICVPYRTKREEVTFKILINNVTILVIKGKSVKTLRKKAYKKIFFYLIDNNK